MKQNWVARILVLVGAVASVDACGTDTFPDDAGSSDGSGEGSTQDAQASDGNADAAGDVAVDGATGDAILDINVPDIPTVRRPFLVGASMRAAQAQRRDDWSDPLDEVDLDADTRAALARAYLDDALQEHASIAAFARFTMMLLAVGAPSDLVRDAQRASIDEVRHARACFSLARRYGATMAGPSPLRVDDALAPMTLAELAALTAEEGCVGETLGAFLAEEQAARATDAVVAPILRRIAEDESRHAELAWRFVTWAVRTGGEEVERAVRAAIERAVAATLAMEVRPLRVSPAAWAAHGRLTCVEARAIARRGVRELVEPAMRALVSGSRERGQAHIVHAVA